MKTIYSISVFSIFLIMCSSISPEEQAIKKDLASRFTGFEIVEIKKDSAEVVHAIEYSLSCKLRISDNNLRIAQAYLRYYGKELDENNNVIKVKPWSIKKVTNYADSITDESLDMVSEYMNLQFSKSKPCYYVKYRIYDGANKIEKEDYYQFREGANEWVHRPCDWNEWLKERGDANLFEEASATYKQLLLDIMY
jgi:hypothetical protein